MNIKETISKWQYILGMQDYEISTEEIDREQVMFPEDISDEDRYFVGIDKSTGVISHHRELTEEDIVHEMLHLGFPDADESFVVRTTETLMKQ